MTHPLQVFSANEEIGDIGTPVLPMLATDFYLGSLLIKLPFTSPQVSEQEYDASNGGIAMNISVEHIARVFEGLFPIVRLEGNQFKVEHGGRGDLGSKSAPLCPRKDYHVKATRSTHGQPIAVFGQGLHD